MSDDQRFLEQLESRFPIAFPHAHFMSLAPIDIWLRLLINQRKPPSPKYWLRLAAAIAPSAIGTTITLPERLGLHHTLLNQYEKSQGVLHHDPGFIFILGYFRSGTTHLHYLLNCDPNLFTPKWFHCCAPHGFILSWAFLRLFMIPFLSETRPQDDVSFGPDYPAEDDFALNNLNLSSSLADRLIFPQNWNRYQRFHDLQTLSQGELTRWRFSQWSFLYKINRLARHRRVLLKSPSHTARLPDLLEMTNANDNAKFIHLTRDPDAVIRSNVRMLKRLSIYAFQNLPSDEELEHRVTNEYIQTEERYLTTRNKITKGNLVEINYDDLITDPINLMRSVYQKLNLPWTDTCSENMENYLHSVRDYKQTNHTDHTNKQSTTRTKYHERITNITNTLQHSHFLAQPSTAITREETGELDGINSASHAINKPLQFKIFIQPLAAMALCVLAWLLIANILHNRYDWLVWPSGITTGYLTLRSAPRGSVRLGVYAAILTLATLLIVSIPNTWTISYHHNPRIPFADIWQTTQHELTAGPTIFWTLMGIITAYRFGSRRRIAPGGS